MVGWSNGLLLFPAHTLPSNTAARHCLLPIGLDFILIAATKVAKIAKQG